MKPQNNQSISDAFRDKKQNLPKSLNEHRKNMLLHPNEKLASKLMDEYAGYSFDQSKDGRLLIERQQQEKRATEHHQELSNEHLKLIKKKDNTKRYIKTANTENPPKPFKAWDFYDQFMFCILLIEIPVILYSGASNVYSNLLASGEPVFQENPSLAIAISLIVPAGATAIKFVNNFFDYQSTKKKFSLLIFGLTGLAMLAWSIVFAMNFSGVSDGFDIEAITASNPTASLLVWLQLFGEMLIGTSLVLAAENIFQKYNPTGETENPDYIRCDKALATLKTHLSKTETELNSIHADIDQLCAERNAFIQEQNAAFIAQRARTHLINQL